MLQVLKDLAKDGRFDPQIEKKVFACYNTLYKNPALAKHILDE